MTKLLQDLRSVLNVTVVIAGLGYFVDLFDLTLFAVVRTRSLNDLGVMASDDVLSSGLLIYNVGLIGMMVGGILWGMLADRKGRLSIMFGSILLYSLATIASGLAWSVPSYAFFRFLCGVGLAGELGAAVTLVAESLPKEKRGLGTSVVATLGMLGVVTAAIVGQRVPWRTVYFIGGAMGLLLLLGRMRIAESTLFTRGFAARANPLLLVTRARLPRYIACILIGVPLYFTTGILLTFAPELTSGLGVKGTVTAGNAILFGSIGLTIGDILSGLFSQVLRSRKRAIGFSLAAGYALMLIYCLTPGLTNTIIYALSLLIGITVGYWAVLVTVAAEQFGTNIRGTVATTVPNFVRGSAVLATTGFAYLEGHMSVQTSLIVVGTTCFGVALLALTRIDETFGRDLDFTE